MKPEKMTPDEVRAFMAAARGDVACDEDAVRQWLARGATHLAALEAERAVGLACLGDAANTRFGTITQAADHLKRAESRLSDILRRLADDQWGWLAAIVDAGGPWPETMATIRARLLGPDATGAAMPPLPNPMCRCGEPESRHDSTGWRKTWEGGPEWRVLCGGFKPAEPSTAEAFGYLRMLASQQPSSVRAEVEHVAALLERRMGRLVHAAQAVTKDGNGWLPGFDELRAALTDAPPVFTLEEVGALERVACECPWRVACECPWRVEATRGDKHAPGCGGGRVREAIARYRGKPAERREWHGCADYRGHTFSEGRCTVEGCGFDLRRKPTR